MSLNPSARWKPALFAALALAGALALTGCSRKSVARVNGLAITEDEFALRGANFIPSASESEPHSVALDVLSSVIQVRVLEKELGEQKELPDDQAVDRRLQWERDRLAFFGENLDEQMRRQGRSETALRQQVSDSLITESFILHDIQASDAEAKQFYDTHPNHDTWHMKERIRLSEISVTSRDRLKKVLADLSANASFGTVAAAWSEDAARQMNGQIPGWFTRDMLQPGVNLPIPHPVLEPAWKRKPGEYSDPPIQVSGSPTDPNKAAWVVVKLEEKKPAESMPFEKVKDFARYLTRREKLGAREQERMKQFSTLMKDAEIEINRPEWEEFLKVFRRTWEARAAQIAGAPGAPGAPGGAAPGLSGMGGP